MNIQPFRTNMPYIIVYMIILNILRLVFDISLPFYLIFLINIFIVPNNDFIILSCMYFMHCPHIALLCFFKSSPPSVGLHHLPE